MIYLGKGDLAILASLLAFALVAKSSRGASLVYAYPPDPTPVLRASKPTYAPLPSSRSRQEVYAGLDYNSEAENSLSDSSSSANGSDNDEVGEEGGGGAGNAASSSVADQYLGFSNAVVASLLLPNRELCDQAFELVLDHLAFVGHPVWLGDDEAMVIPKTVLEEDEDEDLRGQERGRSRRRRENDEFDDMERLPEINSDELRSDDNAESRTNRTVPAAVPHSSINVSKSDSQNPEGAPDPQSSVASSQLSQTSIDGSGRLTSFNFVCIIDTPPDSHLSSHLEGYYKDIVVPVTANIKALERKSNWLGKEVGKVRRARERYLEDGVSATEYVESLPTTCSLTAAICQLFNSLKATGHANVMLGSSHVEVLLRGELPIEDQDKSLEASEEVMGFDDIKDANVEDGARSVSPNLSKDRFTKSLPAPLFSKMRRRPPVRFQAWETLLLLEDPEDLKRDVPHGSLLWKFLDICSPTLSFEEFETLLDVDVDEVPLQGIVEHLIYWRKARVIDVVSLKSVYAASAAFDTATLPRLSEEFATSFPALPPLPALLSQISPTESFSAILPVGAMRLVYLSALLWLLKHEILEKQRMFVRIVASREVKRNAVSQWGNGRQDEQEGVESSSSVGRDQGTSVSSGPFDGSGYINDKTSRTQLEEVKGMAIVGSAISSSPPTSRSHHSASWIQRAAGLHGRRRTTTSDRSRTLSGTTYSSNSEAQEKDPTVPSVIIEPGRPSLMESRWLSEICRDKDKNVVAIFERIVRMLNGCHHLDEIRHRGSISRKNIRTVLLAFQDSIIIFIHP